MRWPVALAALTIALAGCTPVPQPKEEPVALPEDLAWRYVSSCLGDIGSVGPAQISWGDGPAVVSFASDEQTPEQRAAAVQIQECLDRYDYAPTSTSYNYVNSYERAQLYDWYTRETIPCLADKGVEAPRIARTAFFDPAARPWNPYTDMDDVPFDQLIALYRACPPIPEYLQSRHEK